MTVLLKVENLNVSYGAIQALKDVSFHVNSGEIVAFVGANGAGKTTTLHTLSGLLSTVSGKIFFENHLISKLKSHEIVALGISQSPEGRMVFPDLTVQENLVLGSYVRHVSKTQLNTDLNHIFQLFPRLKERLAQPAALLSGGEQQMLAIARALMAKPKLLLLDEPSLGVAPLLTQQIFQKILELNRSEGMTILIAEQNAHMVLSFAHRGYVLEVGSIVHQGQAKDLLHDPNVRKAYLGG